MARRRRGADERWKSSEAASLALRTWLTVFPPYVRAQSRAIFPSTVLVSNALSGKETLKKIRGEWCARWYRGMRLY